MNDKQLDQLLEIESIAKLMQISNDQEQIDGETIQSLGSLILKKCKNIKSND